MDEPADHRATDVVARARAEGRSALLETEAYTLVDALGIRVPAFVFVPAGASATARQLAAVGTAEVVVKVVSPGIRHKTEVDGVRLVPGTVDAVNQAITAMRRTLSAHDVTGFLVAAKVRYAEGLGAELLLGLRWTDDFGPVVTMGLGGVHVEEFARELGSSGIAVFAPPVAGRIEQRLAAKAFSILVTGAARDGIAQASIGDLAALVRKLLHFGSTAVGATLAEFEINPLVFTDLGPTALDVLATVRTPEAGARLARPTHKLRALLEPRSAAVIGVSEGTNPGRTILRNMLRAGFPANRLAVIKAGGGHIDGVPCVPELAALPGPVDLLVVSVAALQVPQIVEEVVARRAAESLIVIPGGLGERPGTEALERRLVDALATSRSTTWEGPVLNGGNCLGVRSVPGHYDTLFIPDHKLPPRGQAPAPLAVIAQSGAFAVSRASKLVGLDPRYLITVGNQSDLTVGDYLAHLKNDLDVAVFACYVEGFRPMDARQWLDAAAEITASGRHVILYRGGRTPAGIRASASHTASIARDYAVTRELAEAAGVLVAEHLDDFDDLVRLFGYLHGKQVGGWRLGGISNAGFECVGIADSLGSFQLGPLAPATVERLVAIFRSHRLDGVVAPDNPVDLTPILRDAEYADAVRLVLEDPGVDVGIVGCVPLTPALATLPADAAHREDHRAEHSVTTLLGRLKAETSKAWVAVVDAGPMYDSMAAHLLELGVPTFRTVDRALRAFEVFCRRQLAVGHGSQVAEPAGNVVVSTGP